MSIFGPGVGGGMLAAAGAVGGAGQGLAEVGKEQQKENLETKMNALTQAREEAITRLQGQQQSGLEEQRAGHEKERIGEEIQGRSAVAHFEVGEKEAEAAKSREFTGTQNTQHQASQEKIAAGHDVARVEAAKSHAPGAKAPPKEWTTKNVNLQGSFDPVSHAIIPGRSMAIQVHRDGSSFVQVGDKLLPYDGSAPDGLGVKPESLRRAPAAEVSKLMQNPLGVAPSGMAVKDSFINRNGYLPASYMAAAQAARDKATATTSTGPGGGAGVSAGAGDEATAPENEDPAETEDNPAPPATP